MRPPQFGSRGAWGWPVMGLSRRRSSRGPTSRGNQARDRAAQSTERGRQTSKRGGLRHGAGSDCGCPSVRHGGPSVSEQERPGDAGEDEVADLLDRPVDDVGAEEGGDDPAHVGVQQGEDDDHRGDAVADPDRHPGDPVGEPGCRAPDALGRRRARFGQTRLGLRQAGRLSGGPAGRFPGQGLAPLGQPVVSSGQAIIVVARCRGRAASYRRSPAWSVGLVVGLLVVGLFTVGWRTVGDGHALGCPVQVSRRAGRPPLRAGPPASQQPPRGAG